MREILLLRPKIGFGIGGAEYHAGMVAVKLLEKGFKIGIIAHAISFPKEILKEIKFYPVKIKGFGSIPKHLFFIFQAKSLLSKLDNYKLISFFRYPYPSDLFIMCDPLIAHLLAQKRPFLARLRPRYRILLNLEKKPFFLLKRSSPSFPWGKP